MIVSSKYERSKIMTITEGLQEIKTLLKRIEKKRAFVKGYLWRQNQIRDPHDKIGGSHILIKQERQAIKDLEDNIIDIKRKIDTANATTVVTICDETRSIAEWLIWRRELAKNRKHFLESMLSTIQSARSQAAQKGLGVSDAGSKAGDFDVIVNINEKALADDIENLETITSTLDGQLSQKNATVNI